MHSITDENQRTATRGLRQPPDQFFLLLFREIVQDIKGTDHRCVPQRKLHHVGLFERDVTGYQTKGRSTSLINFPPTQIAPPVGGGMAMSFEPKPEKAKTAPQIRHATSMLPDGFQRDIKNRIGQ